MKRAILAFSALLAGVAQASPEWEKVIECGDGDAVIDARNRVVYGQAPSYEYQLVIRDAQINKYLKDSGALEPLEGMLRNYPSEILIGTMHNARGDNERIPARAVMAEEILEHGRLISVERDGDNVRLEIFYADRDGALRPRPGARIADWYFRDCRSF